MDLAINYVKVKSSFLYAAIKHEKYIKNIISVYYGSKAMNKVDRAKSYQFVSILGLLERYYRGGGIYNVMECFVGILFFIVIFSYSLYIGVIVFLFSLLMLAYSLWLYRRHKGTEVDDSEFNSCLIEIIDCSRQSSIKGFSGFFSKIIESKSAEKNSKAYASYIDNATSNHATKLIQNSCFVCVLWIGVNLCNLGEISIGQLFALQMLTFRVMHPVMRLTHIGNEHSRMRDSKKYIEELFIKNKFSIGERNMNIFSVEISNVYKAYDGNDGFFLKNININLLVGSRTVISGVSGAGKSTFARIIAGLEPVSSGVVKTLGYELSESLNIPNDSSCIYLDNNPVIINCSIKDNILLREEAFDEIYYKEVINAFSLSESLQLSSAEGLSLGQRQKVNLARAMLASPRLLILDESLNGVDVESERKIIEFIGRKKGMTLIYITHRKELFDLFDYKILIEDGNVSINWSGKIE